MIAGAAIAAAWCVAELVLGHLNTRRGDSYHAASNWKGAVVAGFLAVGFVLASGHGP